MKLWRSLQTRLVLSYLALALLLLTISGIVFSAVLRTYADYVQQQRAAGSYRQVQAAFSEFRLAQLSADEAESRLRQRFPELKIEQVSLENLRIEGFRFNQSIRPDPAPEARRPEAESLEPLAAPGLALRIGLSRQPGPVWHVPYSISRNPPVVFQFTLEAQPGGVLAGLMSQALFVLGLSLALAGLVGWRLSRWLARPLSRLADATAAVASGNFQQNVEPTGVAELDPLVERFNAMVMSLQESFRSLQSERDIARRFAADAAHELKTPVAALRAYHDVAEERPDKFRQVLPGLGRQVERMEQIISSLLEMATLSEGTGITLAPGDLGQVLRESAPGLEALAEDYGHTFEVSAPDGPVPVRLDRRLVEQALSNLVDNACKFTPAPGRVEVRLFREPGEAVLEVSDTGVGIPPEELPFVFERFHRGINTQSVPGTGLGLSIVREAVRRLGGTVGVESTVGEGSRFTIRLPVVQ